MLWEILWRNKNAFSLSFCLICSIISLFWQGNIFSRGVGFIGSLADRVSGVLNSSMRATGSIFVELDKHRELEARYAAAQKLLKEYRLEKDKFDLIFRENARLRKVMGYQSRTDYKEIEAEVLGIRMNSISPRLIIGRGRKDGIQAYMPVITRVHDKEQNLMRAVVGMVIAADNSTAVVQPLTHSAFRLGVRLPETGQWAILSGNSGSISEALLTFISSNDSPEKVTFSNTELKLKQSTVVFTSGAGGNFPRGIPVGVLLREGRRQGEFRTAFVKPFAPIYRLDNVTVILKKPEKWWSGGKSSDKVDEHLVTPFGPAEYPAKSRKKATDKPRRDKKVVKKEEPGQKKEVSGQSDKKNPGDKKEQKPPRRIKNVKVPQ